MSTQLLAGIEAGGTKFVLAVATAARADAITDTAVVPTTEPAATMAAVHDFFAQHAATSRLAGIGIGAFGPIVLEPGEHYGRIVNTPKPGWSDVVLPDALRDLAAPITVDTDVNAAALAEAASMRASRLVYFTVGTGIGAGVVVDGTTLSGRPHPEAGHMSVEVAPGDSYEGRCPYHRRCGEGMAAGPALEARFGVGPGELGSVADRAVPLAAFYIAQLAVNANYLFAPDRVVLGGGIMSIPGVHEAVRAQVHERIGGYTLRTSEDPPWLTAPSLGKDSGIVGALMLAERAANDGT